jgi:hypothetical protein
MISQRKLLNVIDEDLKQCTALRQADASAPGQQNIEHMTLLQHLQKWRKTPGMTKRN